MTGTRTKTTLVAHVETWRPYTLFYVGLVSLAGALLAADDPPAWQLAGAWAAPTLGWIAGLYGGDYFDRDLDALAKPHRPIPSGRLRPRVALTAMCGSIAAGFVITVVLAPWALALAAATAVAGIGYSTVFKKRGLLGNVVRGGLMSAAFLYGVMATVDHFSGWLLACAAVFWLHDAGTNLVGALRDIDGDRAGGYLTAPVRYGPDAAILWVIACWLGWCVTAVVTLLLAESASGTGAWFLLGLAALAGLAAVHQVIRGHGPPAAQLCDPPPSAARAMSPPPPAARGTMIAPPSANNDRAAFGEGNDRAAFGHRVVVVAADGLRDAALRAHEVLVVERLVLAAAFIAVAAGTAAALLLATATVTLTVVAQRGLRRRHELGVSLERRSRKVWLQER